jgi:nicotinic acid mononucleotide adenylyltransferase
MDLVDLSSTTVRARLGDDDDIEDLVPSQIVPLLEGVVE